jgi:hypothetical protein
MQSPGSSYSIAPFSRLYLDLIFTTQHCGNSLFEVPGVTTMDSAILRLRSSQRCARFAVRYHCPPCHTSGATCCAPAVLSLRSRCSARVSQCCPSSPSVLTALLFLSDNDVMKLNADASAAQDSTVGRFWDEHTITGAAGYATLG